MYRPVVTYKLHKVDETDGITGVVRMTVSCWIDYGTGASKDAKIN